jgi:uncharacterized protein (TIGR02117 family)
MRASGRGIAAVGVVFLLLVTLATAKGGDRRIYPPRPGEGVALYLVDNGFHSDLAIPRALLVSHGGPSGAAAKATTGDAWVMAGWGDRSFYEGEGFSFARIGDGLRALFAPHNRSVVHFEGVVRRPDLAWRTGVHRIMVSPAGLAALLRQLDASFALDLTREPIPRAVHRSPDEAFFDSRESFSLLHLCNHWTAELLAAAGVPTTPVLDTLPAGLWLDLKLRAGL